MIRMVPVKCPACGGNNTIQDGQEKFVCSYCGAQIIVDDDSVIKHYVIDEAEIKKVEAAERLHNRQMDIEAKDKRWKWRLIIFYIVACIAISASTFISYQLKAGVTNILLIAAILVISLPLMILISGMILKNDKTTVDTETHSFLFGLFQHSARHEISPGKRVLGIWLLYICIVIFMIMRIDIVPSVSDSGTDSVDNSVNVPMVERVLADSWEQVTDNTIEKDTEYAFMSDDWDVYIATAISDSSIQIARWDKTNSTDEKLEHDVDIGAYKIDDPDNEFYWLDDDHMAFCMSFQDDNGSREGHYIKERRPVVFTINIDDTDKYKGSDYNKKVASFSYENDDWHYYRAIPLLNDLIKVEVWRRNSSDEKYRYAYDLCVINTKVTDSGFEWADNEHTAFTITMQDGINTSYWENPKMVSFVLENPKCKYSCVKDYLDESGPSLWSHLFK